MLDFELINQAALAHLPDLLPELLPEGRFHGREFRCGDLAGNPGQSLSVNTDTGAWCDFANGDDKGGDPVSLVAALQRGTQVEAARWLAGRAGGDRHHTTVQQGWKGEQVAHQAHPGHLENRTRRHPTKINQPR